MRAGITEHIIRVAVAVKVCYCSPGCGGGEGRTCQIITNDIEVDPFGRCRGNIGILIGASECVLHIWMWLRARLAQPITKIAWRSLIEINDVGAAAIDGE